MSPKYNNNKQFLKNNKNDDLVHNKNNNEKIINSIEGPIQDENISFEQNIKPDLYLQTLDEYPHKNINSSTLFAFKDNKLDNVSNSILTNYTCSINSLTNHYELFKDCDQ